MVGSDAFEHFFSNSQGGFRPHKSSLIECSLWGAVGKGWGNRSGRGSNLLPLAQRSKEMVFTIFCTLYVLRLGSSQSNWLVEHCGRVCTGTKRVLYFFPISTCICSKYLLKYWEGIFLPGFKMTSHYLSKYNARSYDLTDKLNSLSKLNEDHVKTI